MSELPALVNDRKLFIQEAWKKSGFGQLTPIQADPL